MNKEQRNAFPTGINNPQSRSANILTEFTVFLTLFILDVGQIKKTAMSRQGSIAAERK
jgi:hypothetical protein